MVEPKPEHLDWFRNLFGLLEEGTVWGIPRSGLTFTKRGNTMVLTDRMPWRVELGKTADLWRAYQDEEYEAVKAHFEAIGVQVNKREGID